MPEKFTNLLAIIGRVVPYLGILMDVVSRVALTFECLFAVVRLALCAGIPVLLDREVTQALFGVVAVIMGPVCGVSVAHRAATPYLALTPTAWYRWPIGRLSVWATGCAGYLLLMSNVREVQDVIVGILLFVLFGAAWFGLRVLVVRWSVVRVCATRAARWFVGPHRSGRQNFVMPDAPAPARAPPGEVRDHRIAQLRVFQTETPPAFVTYAKCS